MNNKQHRDTKFSLRPVLRETNFIIWFWKCLNTRNIRFLFMTRVRWCGTTCQLRYQRQSNISNDVHCMRCTLHPQLTCRHDNKPNAAVISSICSYTRIRWWLHSNVPTANASKRFRGVWILLWKCHSVILKWIKTAIKIAINPRREWDNKRMEIHGN